jgi:hypothetical protein
MALVTDNGDVNGQLRTEICLDWVESLMSARTAGAADPTGVPGVNKGSLRSTV